MKNTFLLLPLTVVLLLVAGCETRSISDSGYRSQAHGYARSGAPGYQGELNEFEVLGIEKNPNVTETDIGRALDSAGQVRVRQGSRVLLIQSGAIYPDEGMVSGLKNSLSVVPFDGRPGQFERETYSKALRLAAARGGCETVVCYWGVLESSRESLDSKAVSWVPIVGSLVPDEHQQMRIKLKMAVIDVRTGSWSMFSPEPFVDKAASARFGRARSDQAQVEKLKKQAYTVAAGELLKVYAQ